MDAIQQNFALGFDWSHYQNITDILKVKNAGYAFSFGKATEGLTYVDPSFAQNYKALKVVAMIRGAYHFARPGLGDPAGQAQKYFDTVNAVGGFDGLPPMLDIEDAGGLSKAALALWIRQFASAIKLSTGMQPLLYTYVSFAEQYLDPSLCAEFQLFIADYGVQQPPKVLNWDKWFFFQHSDSGVIPGIGGAVDLDVFDGTIADLQKYVTGLHTPPTPVQNVDLVRVVTADALNVRVNPDASANVRYVLKKDQTIHISKLQGDWAYTTYGALGGWVARQYLSEPPKTSPAPVQTPQTTITPVGTGSAMTITPVVPVATPTPTPVANSGNDPLIDQAIKAAQALTDCLSKMKGGN